MHLSRTGKHLSRPASRRAVASVGVVATAAALLVAAPRVAVATPPPPPPPKVSAGQVTAAHQAQDVLASKVGVLGAQIAQEQLQLAQSVGRKELAEQKVALAVSQLRNAQDAAQRAVQHERAAQRSVSTAHAKFVAYVQATYTGGTVEGTAGSLLTATDPSALLDRSTLEQYQASNQVDAIGALQSATVAKSNSEAAARRAVRDQSAKAAKAKQARETAVAVVAVEEANRAALQNNLASSQQQLDSAQSQLATLTHQRAAYVAFKVEQARIAAAKALAARIAAAKALAARLAEAKAAARARAAAYRAARSQARHHRHSGHSNGGGGGGGNVYVPVSSGPSAPSSGSWTAAKGRRAVSRAMSTLGTPYAWAGGGTYGPSRGVCDAGAGAGNDCNVIGYDCSGLTMYAWGENWDHYAATQYNQAGHYHPSISNLKPGDLVFFTTNGQVDGIHHVAIYKGHGNIVEAPYSGGYVQTNQLSSYYDYFGATRPLT